ncbi:DUF3014 domain-containing protein [Flocculibacter collagenilyticus]|uniref:DUF3014 domain-containing protein n=1 Tax=Flocculibacter collagenilyticus TaxID=2744479 RepID=UPI0018F338C1|nr:DUF3014 domain-containing protein [Flocculibacter collagenilyticus]
MQRQQGKSSVLILGLVIVLAILVYASWQLFEKKQQPNNVEQNTSNNSTNNPSNNQSTLVPKVNDASQAESTDTDEPFHADELSVDEENGIEATEYTEDEEVAEGSTEQHELPPLGESDEVVIADLKDASFFQDVSALVQSQHIIQRLVVFTDNLVNGDVIRESMPFVAPSSRFSVIEEGERIILDPESFHRYDPYVALMESIPPQELAELYEKYHPLLNTAYAEIGYPDSPFKEKLVSAIEEVLDTPIIEGEIELVTPKVMYEFKDPELESLTPLQKQVIRLGPDNARKIKEILQDLRNHLLQ